MLTNIRDHMMGEIEFFENCQQISAINNQDLDNKSNNVTKLETNIEKDQKRIFCGILIASLCCIN